MDPRAEVRWMGQVEASGVVEAGRRELFYYTDWCYNVPEWFEPVRRTQILRLPDAAGMGKVTHYAGTLLGRDMEWEARSADWSEDETWSMRACEGMPAKMNLGLRLRFEAVDAGRTRVTCGISYHAPYPLLGAIIDRFYLRREAVRLANLAVRGLQRVGQKHRVRSIEAEFEERKRDHPGYAMESPQTAAVAHPGE